MNSLNIALLMIRRTILRKRGFITFFLLPCLVVTGTIALFGSEEGTRAVIPYVNEDQGPAGAWILNELGRKEEYLLKPMKTVVEVNEAIAQQTGSSGLVIPTHYTDDLLQDKQPEVQLVELRVRESSYTLRAAVEGLAAGLNQSASAVLAATDAASGEIPDPALAEAKLKELLLELGKHQISGEATELQMYPKPGLNNVTGFTIMFMMGLLTSTVAVIMEDRRQRTMARVYTAPVRAYEIALGNFLGSFAIGLIQIVWCWGLADGCFIMMRGSHLAFTFSFWPHLCWSPWGLQVRLPA
ncbi:ABC transporter permease [Paenibacillus sp. E222]|uniref:ABC transporter permease n=1 Tax=Paenibacillus sp. E222 TaxID=2748863 RepID=UPI00211CA223|nr:ABC transporter permease [Paenibacillus sp. E222]